MWEAVKAVHNGKCIALNANIKKEKGSKLTDQGFHYRKLGNEDQINSKEEQHKKNKLE